MTKANFEPTIKPTRNYSERSHDVMAMNEAKRHKKAQRKQAAKNAQLENDFHNSFVGAEYEH